MPIYEYRCSACGFEKEYLQKLADAPIVVCESCGQSTMSKLVSAAGFQLKGSGWYVTDFKNAGGKGKAPETDKKEPAAKEGQSDSSASSEADKKSSGAENKKSSESTDSKGSGADTKSAAEPAAR